MLGWTRTVSPNLRLIYFTSELIICSMSLPLSVLLLVIFCLVKHIFFCIGWVICCRYYSDLSGFQPETYTVHPHPTKNKTTTCHTNTAYHQGGINIRSKDLELQQGWVILSSECPLQIPWRQLPQRILLGSNIDL